VFSMRWLFLYNQNAEGGQIICWFCFFLLSKIIFME
jgi:hypothetical protein